MRIFDPKIVNIVAIGLFLNLMPMAAYAFDHKRTISKDELSDSYGTIAKSFQYEQTQKPTPKRSILPLTPHFEKGSFAYSLGVEAARNNDYERAEKHWLLSSDDGNFYADWQLARYYLGAFNDQKNDVKALKFLRLVASQNGLNSESRTRKQISADAMVELANFYTVGSNTAKLKPHLQVALKLLKLAASAVGHPTANYRLGELYFTGDYLKPQKNRAIRYYIYSARKNNFLAQIKLGEIFYLHGRNSKDRREGLAWLLIAKKNKSPNLQGQVDQIIAKTGKSKLTSQQLTRAQNMADNFYLKWKF